jgi:hypothetical protein
MKTMTRREAMQITRKHAKNLELSASDRDQVEALKICLLHAVAWEKLLNVAKERAGTPGTPQAAAWEDVVGVMGNLDPLAHVYHYEL